MLLLVRKVQLLCQIPPYKLCCGTRASRAICWAQAALLSCMWALEEKQCLLPKETVVLLSVSWAIPMCAELLGCTPKLLEKQLLPSVTGEQGSRAWGPAGRVPLVWDQNGAELTVPSAPCLGIADSCGHIPWLVCSSEAPCAPRTETKQGMLSVTSLPLSPPPCFGHSYSPCSQPSLPFDRFLG